MAEQIQNYKDDFFQNMNQLRLKNILCDVCFDINGKSFSCHRVVLATVSPYFRTMFNGNFKESTSDVIPIRDVESEAFEEILNAVYTSNITLLPSNAYCILKASHMMELETIKDACITYISNNSKISYLIDACLFALNIKKMELYSKCVQAISDDLLTYGRTECFENIPLDMFRSILSSRSISDEEEEAVFLLISQWCKDNKANCNDTKMLLEAASLKTTKNIRPIVMANLIVNSALNCALLNDKSIKIIKESEVDTLSFNLYFNGIDVKTCDKGWGILKINDEFNKYVLSSFHATDSHCQRVCQVESRIYCLESKAEKNVLQLSCYDENDELISPKIPPLHFKSFDMTTIDKTIYVLKKDNGFPNGNCLLAYDCERNTWETKFLGFFGKVEIFRDKKPQPFILPDFPIVFPDFLGYNLSSLTSSDDILYLIAEKPGESNRYLTSLDFRTPNAQLLGLIRFEQDKHVNAAVCAFDKKIALSGSNHQGGLHNTFSIFDITAKRWLYDVEPMLIGRANHNLIHRNGFVYAVENQLPFVNNEKYDVKLNKWITIPPLPRRVAMESNDDIIPIATGNVFGIDVLC